MARHLEREIDRLKRKILGLGAMVEESVDKSVAAIVERDGALAAEVIEADIGIDVAEVEVEEECLKILALHQPVANDLRFVVAVLKLNNDLERIGDLAVNIAEQADFLASQDPPRSIPFDIPAMAGHVRAMLAGSLDSLVNLDPPAARRVCAADDVADEMHRGTFRAVEEGVRRDPAQIAQLTHYLSVSRYLERIADHATNIAEDVIYLVEGEIVRHRGSAA